MRLGGWHRLWAVLAIAWSLWVAAATWYTWPQFEVIHLEDSGDPIWFTPESQPDPISGLIDPNQRVTREAFAARLRSTYPNSYDDFSDEELVARVLRKYPQYGAYIIGASDSMTVLASMRLRTERAAAVRSALIMWLVPPIALYAVGFASRWVYRGFRPRQS